MFFRCSSAGEFSVRQCCPEPVRSCDGEDPVGFFFSRSVRIRNDSVIPGHADMLPGGRWFVPHQVGCSAKFVWFMLRSSSAAQHEELQRCLAARH
mmetsp:Transcript_9869/g.27538  ORF Transcript_9869/g.27538 Transcript_9869/m.27538 type:complete len:95 (-) Transcript_9869:261-545(-)